MALNVFDRLLNAIPQQERIESDIAFRVAERVDFLMRKNNISQSDLARGLNKDHAQISRWMSGRHNFSLRTLAELEIFFKEEILVSPTATEEVAEYTQYVAEQAANKRQSLVTV
jgi:transcriptional regulator with XRE-family HTH domain